MTKKIPVVELKIPVEIALAKKSREKRLIHQKSSHITQTIGKYMPISKKLRAGFMKMTNDEISSLAAAIMKCINENRSEAIAMYLETRKTS